jgi:DNA-binding NarL/FixJ family response regulator
MKKTKQSIEEFNFTPQEKKLAAFVAVGTPIKIIADKMSLSKFTVGNYMRIVRLKLGVSTTYEAGCVLAHYFPPANSRR